MVLYHSVSKPAVGDSIYPNAPLSLYPHSSYPLISARNGGMLLCCSKVEKHGGTFSRSPQAKGGKKQEGIITEIFRGGKGLMLKRLEWSVNLPQSKPEQTPNESQSSCSQRSGYEMIHICSGYV